MRIRKQRFMQNLSAPNAVGAKALEYKCHRGRCAAICAIVIASLGILHSEDAQIPTEKVSGQGDQEFLQKVETGQIPAATTAPKAEAERPVTPPAPAEEKRAPAPPPNVSRQASVAVEEQTRRSHAEKKSAQPRGPESTPQPKALAHEKQKDSKKGIQSSEPPVETSSVAPEASFRSSATRSRDRVVLNSAAQAPTPVLAAPLPPGTTVTTVTTKYKGPDGRIYTEEKKTTTYPQPARPKFRLFHRHDEDAAPAAELSPFQGGTR